MGNSQRFLSGSLTKGSIAISIGSESDHSNFDHYKQGHNIQTIDDVSAGLVTKIRSNSDILRTISEKRFDNKPYYDDSLAPLLLSGSSAEISSPSVAGRFKYYVDHVQEKRDLGQTEYYANSDPFTELANPDNPVEVILIKEKSKSLPFSLVDNSSLSSFDGKIDVLELLKSVDGSTTDFPFNPRGIMGDFGENQDFLKRGLSIDDKILSPGNNSFVATPFYLDAPENFGDVLLPSIMNFNDIYIKPFKDISDDVEEYLDESGKFTESGNSDIKAILMSGSFTVDDTRGTFDRMTVGGFDYEDSGTDSILYGGMKR